MDDPWTKAPAAIMTGASYPGISQGSGRHKAVHRRRRLDALAEGDDALRRSEGDGLDDVVTGLGAVWHHVKAQVLIDIGRKDGAL